MNLGKIFRKREKEEAMDLQNRANQFMAEYKVIRVRYRCDFQGFLKMVDGGEGGIVPNIRIIDITKTVEAEEEAERKKQESKISIEKVKEPKPLQN